MTDQTTIDTENAIPAGALADQVLADEAGDTNVERDFESEARKHGWTPKEEFRGDANKWVDAETFVKRADEVMPFLQKQNKALKREIDDLKRTMKQAQEFYTKAEKRAYNQALADLEARHADAVETGDVAAAKKVMADMRSLESEFTLDAPTINAEPEFDEKAARAELAEWVEKTGWYGPDESRTKYADMQADLMGPAKDWPGGQKAWLAELEQRVDRKFTAPKPSVANPGGSRPGARGGSKAYADLPADAKRQCDRFVKMIPGFTREQFCKDYDWN
jgi:hypothetical protein